jgi:parvulin-like peptidyl-prolyl isomerase
VSPRQQGKKGRTATPEPSAGRKRIALVGFAVLVVALFAIVAAAQGLGEPSVPDDAIAVVEDAPDGTITKEEFDRALVQTAARQGLEDVPAADDPQYQSLADAAESDLLLQRWVRGEAEDMGIEVTETQIDDELAQIKQQQFNGSEEQFQKFLDQSGFSEEEARDRIELQVISDEIQKQVLPDQPGVTEAEINAYYEDNAAQFEQPETRDVRVVLTKTEQEANQAKAELGTDPQPKDWEAVAKKYSIDEATKSVGGLRQGVVEGQSEAALDQQIFSAPQGQLVGPFQTDAGWYVIDVEKVTPAATTPLSDATEQIRQTLASARQQELASAFQEDFQTKWVSRTFCADGYRIEQCSNAEAAPSPCTEQVASKSGCDAVVASTKPIMPGTAGVFGAPAAAGLPQGPITQSAAAVPADLQQGIPGATAPLPPGG